MPTEGKCANQCCPGAPEGGPDDDDVPLQGDSGDGGPATQASLNEPYDICLYGDDVLLISDYFNNRIRAVKL